MSRAEPVLYEKRGEKRYRIQAYLGTDPLTGKPVKTTISDCKTKKEAYLKAAQKKLEFEKGMYKKRSLTTYQEVFDEWMPNYENKVEESTFQKTSSIFRNHILPAMGQYRIEKITVQICQRHVNEWAKKLKKFKTVRSYAAKVLDHAMKLNLIPSNPFKLVELPSPKKMIVDVEEDLTESQFYTKDELNEFLECVKKQDDLKKLAFFRLLAYSGMRKGEAFALTWKDINFDEQTIRIIKALSNGKGNRLYVKSTKTGETRTIKMDSVTLEILKEWKKQQRLTYLKLGYNTNQASQLVFSNKYNKFLQLCVTNKWIKSVQKKYKLKEITTHQLRHTHCSLLFEAGATLKEVQDRMGHNDSNTTMDIYTHVTKKAKEGAVLKFAEYMNS